MEKKKGSKELLKESVIELVEKMPVKKVTVEMICQNCGVSQRTFYNYFKDKYELISWVYTEVLEEQNRDDHQPKSMHATISALVVNIVSHSRFYCSAVRFTGQNSFMRSIFQPLRESTLHLIRDTFHDDITEDISNAVDFYIFGCIGFMEYHLLQNDITPAGETIKIFEDNIPSLLKKYL